VPPFRARLLGTVSSQAPTRLPSGWDFDACGHTMDGAIQGHRISSFDDLLCSAFLRMGRAGNEHLTAAVRAGKFLQQRKSCGRALDVFRDEQEMCHGQFDA